tara:strand:- start:32 stop:514 length:483 start_codon:yes stop_codon:yes gene_type:complete
MPTRKRKTPPKKKKYTKVLLRGGKKYQDESVWVKLISGDVEKGVGTIANDPINPKYSYGEKISWKGGIDMEKWATVSKVKKTTKKRKSPAKKTTTRKRKTPAKKKTTTKKKTVYRGKRPSPSASATSVTIGTKRRGGDGKMYVCKSYKRGNKRVKRWVKA